MVNYFDLNYDSTEIQESILILHLLNHDIRNAKDAINKSKTEGDNKDLNLVDIVNDYIYLKIFCFFEEWEYFKKIGGNYPKVKNITKILKPITKYLAHRKKGIEKVRHQIIAHTYRMKKSNSLSNFYEIAISESFPSQFTELGLMIDLINLLCQKVEEYFSYEFSGAHEKFLFTERNFEIRKAYFAQEKFTLENAQITYSDIEAKVLSNFRRANRGEQLLK
jgi:hypothetical protein